LKEIAEKLLTWVPICKYMQTVTATPTTKKLLSTSKVAEKAGVHRDRFCDGCGPGMCLSQRGIVTGGEYLRPKRGECCCVLRATRRLASAACGRYLRKTQQHSPLRRKYSHTRDDPRVGSDTSPAPQPSQKRVPVNARLFRHLRGGQKLLRCGRRRTVLHILAYRHPSQQLFGDFFQQAGGPEATSAFIPQPRSAQSQVLMALARATARSRSPKCSEICSRTVRNYRTIIVALALEYGLAHKCRALKRQCLEGLMVAW